MTLPDFFIIGAPKCGSTALFHYLGQHPAVFVPAVKEPHFYASDLRPSNYVRSAGEYAQLFRDVEPEHLAVGEASICYLYSKVAAKSIRDARPDARFIVMFRDPVEQFVSLHNQAFTSLFEDEPDPERAWELQVRRRSGRDVPALCEEPRFLQYHDFCSVGDQLRRWLDVFPENQFHVVLFDDLVADPRKVYQETLEFLGLPDDGLADFAVVNASHRPRSRGLRALQTKVDRLYRKAPGLRTNRWLVRALGPASRFVTRWNQRPFERAPLRAQFQDSLRENFTTDVELLGSLVGRPVPWAETLHVDRTDRAEQR